MELNLEKLTAVRVLGKGAMGTVFLMINCSDRARCPFALKVVEKSTIHTKFEADRRARWEMTVLSRLSHPFLPTLLGSNETDDFLAWAVPYCPAGDLNALRYLQTDHIFSTSAIRFYVSEIVCALAYLHRMGIVYRDLKPENVLIQESGHVMLTDFDLSRSLARRKRSDSDLKPLPTPKEASEPRRTRHRRNRTLIMAVAGDKGLKKAKSARVSPVSRRKASFYDRERSNSFVGTEEYVSPEVVLGDGHEFAVDWWALGILTYEMAYGKTPFRGGNRKETFRNILTASPKYIGKRSELTDFISQLLEKDATRRLGFDGGADEIKAHPFFNGVRWDLLTEISRPPFLVPFDEETDVDGPLRMGVAEYFQKLRQQTMSPPMSPSFDGERDSSFF